MTEKRQGPTPGVRRIEVSVKRELTVFLMRKRKHFNLKSEIDIKGHTSVKYHKARFIQHVINIVIALAAVKELLATHDPKEGQQVREKI